ncbi:hypothetical protein KBA63_00120 [Candidatus Woesebacteria bacterium]|nr:hypothetical protein [Candidatus Woesebacteria bacterium]
MTDEGKEKARCNCFVGILNDYNHDWRLYIADGVYKQCKLYRSSIDPKKLMNSAMATKFKFCPRCGDKINWNILLNPQP